MSDLWFGFLFFSPLEFYSVELTYFSLPTDPEGIANAQKSLGIGQEEKARRVR